MTAEEIFLAAVEKITPSERAAFLDGACAGNAELRAQVERLLTSHQKAGSFLDQPLFETPTIEQPHIAETPGTRIGLYKLMEQIGEGGMGLVFVAEQQQPVRRKVALKVIKPGMDTRDVIARFEAERQALALMDHPNIARVFDAGATASGRPYFVMELVKGVPITQYCDENRLSTRERLELFTHVCHAVQHAHQKGIIHRDIKPTNLLVCSHDGTPVVKVIDFGVSKAIGQQLTERTIYTALTQMVGTPLYMSPEQAGMSSLDIDTRTDIYSMGVLLYELLTGTTPFDKDRMKRAAFDEVRRIIREEEPPKPSTRISSTDTAPSIAAQRHTEPGKLARLVRGELDWIVMKALEKDRNRRYETANGLVQDLERYLRDEPVQACPPSAGYRLRKFARRNTAALATSGFVIGALVLGTVVSTWQAVRATTAENLAQTRLQAEVIARNDAEQARKASEVAREGESRQRQLAQDSAEEAETQKQQAEANFAQARAAVDSYFVEVSESELLKVPGLQPLRQQLLRSALGFYQEFVTLRGGDPQLQEDLAQTLVKVGQIHTQLETHNEARKAYRDALEMFRQLLKDQPDRLALKAGESTCLGALGEVALAVQGWEHLLQLDPANNQYRRELAQEYNSRAIKESNANKHIDALASHQKARDLRILLVAQEPMNAEYLNDLGQTLNNIGAILGKQGRGEDALTLYREAIQYGEKARAQAPAVLKYGMLLITALGNVGSVERTAGRRAEALAAFQQRAEVTRSLAMRNPAVPSLQKRMFDAFRELAILQQELNQPQDAARSLRQAREVMERLPRETSDDWYVFAQIKALCAAPPSGDADSLPEDPRDRETRAHDADEAITALRTAIEKRMYGSSMFDINIDPSLAALRERDDFRGLVDQLAQRTQLSAIERQKDNTAKLTAASDVAESLAKLAAAAPQNMLLLASYARSRHATGLAQLGLGQLEAAEKSLNEALRIRADLRDRQTGVPEAVLQVVETRIALAEVYEKSARLPQAHVIRQQCLSELRDLPHDAKLAGHIVNLEIRICHCYGTLGIWPLAAVHAQRNAELRRSVDPVWSLRCAILLPLTGQEAALPGFCRSCEEQSGGSGGRVWSQQDLLELSWLSGLTNPPALPAEKLEQWARPYESSKDPWCAFCVALARHRAGKHAAALEILDSFHTEADSKTLGNYATKLSAAYLCALAAKGAAQEDRARQQLQNAEALLQQVCRDCVHNDLVGLTPPLNYFWWELAAAQILRGEAWRIIEGHPEPEMVWMPLIAARGYRAIGDVRTANGELEKAAPENCSDFQSARARADLLQSWGETARAEADWRTIAESAPEDPLPWVHRGRFYSALSQQPQAAECFAEAIAPKSSTRPSLAAIPFSANEAERLQLAWADHLGVPLEFQDELGIKFRLIPPGVFDMGTPPDVLERVVEDLRRRGTPPVFIRTHEEEGFVRVYLTAPYYMARCEVTVRQFRSFVDDTGYVTDAERKGIGGWGDRNGEWVRHPSHVWKSPSLDWQLQDDQPVVHISWNDAMAFCTWLNQRENLPCTLPTEAQWEFACRGGSPLLYGAGDDPSVLEELAWTRESCQTAGVKYAQPVGGKRANPFGLHDMLGSVFEWCADSYAPGPKGSMPLVDPVNSESTVRRVARGGSWVWLTVINRCGHRISLAPDDPIDAAQGFRIAIVGDLKRVTRNATMPVPITATSN